jgi:hypothetical protein
MALARCEGHPDLESPTGRAHGRALPLLGLGVVIQAVVLMISDAERRPVDPQPVSSSDAGNYLIALAAAPNAGLVSGDRHLVDFKGRLHVYSPATFSTLPQPAPTQVRQPALARHQERPASLRRQFPSRSPGHPSWQSIIRVSPRALS